MRSCTHYFLSFNGSTALSTTENTPHKPLAVCSIDNTTTLLYSKTSTAAVLPTLNSYTSSHRPANRLQNMHYATCWSLFVFVFVLVYLTTAVLQRRLTVCHVEMASDVARVGFAVTDAVEAFHGVLPAFGRICAGPLHLRVIWLVAVLLEPHAVLVHIRPVCVGGRRCPTIPCRCWHVADGGGVCFLFKTQTRQHRTTHHTPT